MNQERPDTAANPGDRAAAIAEERRRLMREVLTRQRRMVDVESGLRVGYARPDVSLETLEELSQAWPHFQFELVPGTGDDAELSWVEISGPPGTGEAFRQALQAGPAAFKRPSTIDWRWRLLTSSLRVRPDFIIIGTSKGGTTSLYSYLFQHPCVLPPSRKELFFFDRDYARGVYRYRAHFPTVFHALQHRLRGRPFVTGEASPTYLDHPEVPRRVRRAIPGVKLIAILRNPVDRAHSLYQLKVRSGEETLTWEEALAREQRELEHERERVAADAGYFSRLLHHHAYLSGGIYVDHLQRWRQVFPEEQLLVLSSNELLGERARTLERVHGFLRLPPHTPERFDDLNKSPAPRMESAVRDRLREYFRPHNERLWDLLGVDYGWNEPDVARAGSA